MHLPELSEAFLNDEQTAAPALYYMSYNVHLLSN